MGEDKIIKLLRLGDNKTLQKIYIDNRRPFIKYAKKFNINENDALDIYQDAIVALRENALKGKLNNLQSNLSTYLFAIAKNKIYRVHREKSKLSFDEGLTLDEKNIEIDVDLFDKKLTNEQIVLRKWLPQLGERCKEILNLYYYKGFNLDEITQILNYSNKQVLKSQKSRCLKKLKELCRKKI
jgi:RNA polymerase sigma factor (sigma-70 family)